MSEVDRLSLVFIDFKIPALTSAAVQSQSQSQSHITTDI
jgi:hypothetical protein